MKIKGDNRPKGKKAKPVEIPEKMFDKRFSAITLVSQKKKYKMFEF